MGLIVAKLAQRAQAWLCLLGVKIDTSTTAINGVSSVMLCRQSVFLAFTNNFLSSFSIKLFDWLGISFSPFFYNSNARFGQFVLVIKIDTQPMPRSLVTTTSFPSYASSMQNWYTTSAWSCTIRCSVPPGISNISALLLLFAQVMQAAS